MDKIGVRTTRFRDYCLVNAASAEVIIRHDTFDAAWGSPNQSSWNLIDQIVRNYPSLPQALVSLPLFCLCDA